MQAHPSIVVLGYSEAAMLLQGARCPDIKAVISIFARHEYPVETPVGVRRLELHFDDADLVNTADPSEA
jgi:hypothetical protein